MTSEASNEVLVFRYQFQFQYSTPPLFLHYFSALFSSRSAHYLTVVSARVAELSVNGY